MSSAGCVAPFAAEASARQQCQRLWRGSDYSLQTGNHHDPLGTDVLNSGSGATNPAAVAIHQYMSDGIVTQTFEKSDMGRKPRITQSITEWGKMHAYFELDMSHIGVNQFATVGANMVNRIDFLDDAAPDFDMAEFEERAALDEESGIDINVNAGNYVYFEGGGSAGAHGFYYYLDGSEDVINTDWKIFFDFSQDNPWSINANRPVEQ